MLSQKSRYALKALLELARNMDEPSIMIGDIAERQNIPRKFLEQILLELKHRGILHSRRGKNGGYAMLKDPAEVTFGAVVRIFEGPLAPLPCLSRTAYRRCDDCDSESSCDLRRVFSHVYHATMDVLDHTSLADAINGVEMPPLE